MSMRDSTANDSGAAAAPASFAAAAQAVAVPFLVTRAGVLLVGLLAAVFIGYVPEPNAPSGWQVAADPVRNLLARWDAFWYLDIATRGYHWNGNPLQQQNVVFFPLLPLLMRLGGALIGGHLLIAGLAVSLTAFFFALCYFWRWTADRAGPDAATGAVWLLSAFPSAIFFSAVYTESLYLLIAIAACYYAEGRRFVRSALIGFVGGLVRPNGLLLSIPIAWIAFVSGRDRGRDRLIWRAIAAAAPVLGVLCFSAYLFSTVGNGTAWIANQAAWPRDLNAPPPDPHAPMNLWWIQNAVPLALVVIAVAPLTALLGSAYGLFVVSNVAPPLLRHGLLSMGRFSSVMFPVFAWLAIRARGRARTRIIVAFAIGQAVLAALFFIWEPII
jgi:hypothetical protein